MAISVSVDTVSFNPGKVKYSNGKKVENELLATEFSELFGLDYQETLNKIQSDSSVVVIARKVETDIVKKLKDWMDASYGIKKNAENSIIQHFEDVSAKEEDELLD